VRPPSLATGALLIQLLAALVIAGHLAAALVVLLRTQRLPLARLTAAEGVIAGLGLMTAATLLKSVQLRTWDQIALFAVILGLRIGVKRLFAWERGCILARERERGVPTLLR
jgi:uncharacterized membrane protein AbrB (regulator of aidB expression)